MTKDPIIGGIHKVREEYTKRFDNDLRAICKDAQAKQGRGGRKVVQAVPKRASIKPTGDAERPGR